jgi:hypothetical protein
MTAFTTSKDSGFPNAYDFYSPGSEITAKNKLQTPSGFNTSAPSASLNKHQESQTSVPIGVPGTTYTPHTADQVYSTVGGHYLIFGNAPGSETVRLQSKAGAAIELSDDGSIRVVSASGLHIAINGDNQIVLQGDYAITTSGTMKFKAGSIIFDTAEMIMNVHGDMSQYVDGDYNQEIIGDKHTLVTGDASNMVGGNLRDTITGDYRSQVTGNRKVETGKDHSALTKGVYQVSSVGSMFHLTNGDALQSAQGIYSAVSVGNTSISSQQNMDITSGSDMRIGSKSIISMFGDTGFNLNSNAVVQMTSTQNFKIDSGQTVFLTGGTNINGYAPRIDWNSNTRLASVATVSPGISVPIQATYPEVPDKNLILDSISDYVATGGQMDNIVSAEQVHMMFTEGEVSGEVPKNVLDRLAEKGIEYPPKTIGTVITTINTDNLKSNISTAQGDWNPGVV